MMAKSMTLRTNKANGFTLIEVMIALAIFSIAGVALSLTANTNANTTALIEERMLASWVASNQLVEMKLQAKWPPQNNQKGEVELAQREWFWKQVVKKTTDDNLNAVIMEVRDSEKDEHAITSLITYVAKGK